MVCTAALESISGRSQQTGSLKKKVVEALYPSDAPVQVDDLRVSGKSIKLGEKFDSDEEWLKHLSLKIKNKSNKSVVAVQIDLFFPETKASGNMMTFPLWVGQDPLSGSGSAARLTPDDSTDLSISSKEYAKLKNFIERRHSLSSIQRIIFQMNSIYFEDGTIWSYGSWVRRDPLNPSKLIPIANR